MKDKINPYAFALFGSVVALIISFEGFQFGGGSVLFFVTFLSMAVVGYITGSSWRVYPWQIGLVGLAPSLVFLLWRIYSSADPENIALNTSLFVFLPVISLVAGSFGAYTGRWASHRKRRQAASAGEK